MKQLAIRLDPEIRLLLLLSIFAWGALLNPAYFFRAHDAQHSIFYLVEFDQTFRDGYFWPRWSPDFAFGYGYPLFNIYAPLSIYLAELIHLVGLGKVEAVKTGYILATIGAGLGMAGFARRLFGRRAGVLAGAAYMFAPFHLLEIYVRSAYAEFVSLALLPLILWAFTALIEGPNVRRLMLAAAGYGLLALTHHTTFFTFTPFLLLYILVLMAGQARWSLRQWFRLGILTGLAGVLGVALAAVYLIPMLLERHYIKLEQWTGGSYNAQDHFVYFAQLFAPDWRFGYSGPGPVDDMSFQIGIIIYALAIFALVGAFAYGREIPRRGIVLIFLGAGLLSIWLLSPWAESAWGALPFAALVQFPWRLLIIVMLSLSVVIGALAAMLPFDDRTLALTALVVVLGSYTYTQPQYTDIPDYADTPQAVIEWDRFSPADRVGMVVYTDEQPTTSPMEAQYLTGTPIEAAAVIAGNAQVRTLHRGGASTVLEFSGQQATVQFYTYDYPGWNVFLSGTILPHRHEPPYGLITVDVPAGDYVLELNMGTTPPRVLGGILSLLALGIIVIGVAVQSAFEAA